MEFSPQQQACFDHYVAGHNVFLTGPGGSGKTSLIRHIYQHALDRKRQIQVCALTGCAAVLLECAAKTVHSWSGIGLCTKEHEEVVDTVARNRFLRAAWLLVDVLVVDEISMMSEKLFKVLDAIGKRVRRNTRPFGGIQLVFSGDFFQLPPVGQDVAFCFESDRWPAAFPYCVQLRQIFRQTDDVYANILNHIRKGVLKRSMNTALLARVGQRPPDTDATAPTRLFPLRAQADAINTGKLEELTTPAHQIAMAREYDLPPRHKADRILNARTPFSEEDTDRELRRLESRTPADSTLVLKVGAQVMCIVNIVAMGLVNGSQGIVREFDELGMPVVDFGGSVPIPMGRHVWRSEANPRVGVSQVPLILAWALTIHKSQGATLESAEIDAGPNIFECGQTYVALSRVKSLSGLYLVAFDASSIRINTKVLAFYAALDAAPPPPLPQEEEAEQDDNKKEEEEGTMQIVIT
jgi:ATP-dependent DNA helicase PIF1